MEISIPKEKGQICKYSLDSPQIIAPNGEELFVYVPQNEEELKEAWKVLEDYTKRIAPNPESVYQDLDDIADVIKWHFGKELGYIVFTAVDSDKNPKAVATTEIASLSDMVGKYPGAKDKGMGFIYQIGHNEEVSFDDEDFSVITQLYGYLPRLLPEISIYKDNNWLGIVTESRKEGAELEAILDADFEELVSKEFYRPPAVQQEKIKDKENRTTTDLVLLGLGIPTDSESRLMVAEAYLTHAYRQPLEETLKLVNNYFAEQAQSK
ncbi:MAG: hypothetical protein KAS87_02145 [Candidatus Omnitrophica bacterium]|nr:hypothetical protein [Candidatus Omnitrophota bacterium]